MVEAKVRVVDVSTAAGEDGDHETTDDELGSTMTAYVGSNDRLDDNAPVPASIQSQSPLHVRLYLSSFHCERRSGEVGKDEVYFATSGGADGLVDWTHRTDQFGSLKQDQWRDFSSSAILYQGPVSERLAVNVEAWEQDNSDSGWYDAVVNMLGKMGDELIRASEDAKGDSGWPVNKYTLLVGATSKLISVLMDWF